MYYNSYGSIYSYDLTNNSITNVYNTGMTILDMKYDMFMHAILVRTSTTMYCYDISTGAFYIQCDLPDHSNSTYSSIPMAYNPYTKAYAFFSALAPDYEYDSAYYVHVNILTGEILDTVHPIQYQPVGWHHLGHYWQCSYPDHAVYVIHKEAYNSNQYYLSTLNLSDATFEDVLPIPSDYYSHLNFQLPAFNQLSNTYLLPYYTTDSQNKLIVADINNQSIYTLPFLAQTNRHYADYLPAPVLILENDSLKANYYTNYTWYLDSLVINGEDQQFLVPQINGTYYYSTCDSLGNDYYSNEILINWLGVDDVDQIRPVVSLYPNPTDGKFNIDLLNESLNLENYSYQIHDLVGKLLEEGKLNQGILQKVDIVYFTPGMYIVSVTKGKHVLYSTKLVKNY